MGKVSTFFNCILSVALVGGLVYGGYTIKSNMELIPQTEVSYTAIPNEENNQGNVDSTQDNVIKYRNIQLDNNTDVYMGNLVSITIDNYMNYNPDNLELQNIYENKVSGYTVNSIDFELNRNTMEALNSMMTDYISSTDNTDMMIKSAYISIEDIGNIIECDHLSGLSFNLCSYDGDTIKNYDGTGDFEWFSERADKYGFIFRYPSDKTMYTGNDEISHFRYVGLPHSAYMKENNLCLEEYIATVKLYTYDNPLEITTFNGKTYDVYFVPMEENNSTTNVPVLMDKEYSVSGDNKEGYIVTVKVSG